MKRFNLAAAAAAPLLLSGLATAGDYHVGTNLLCGQCHVMHYSQSHGYNPDGSGAFTPLANGPNEYLLRDTINNLCLSCHDGNSVAPDVLGVANTGSSSTDVRLAGYLNRLAEPGGPAEGLDPTGHTLNSLADAPGSNPTWSAELENGTGVGLSCTNCHNQHGWTNNLGSSYRNLKINPGNTTIGTPTFVSYATGTNNTTLDVFQRSITSPQSYDESQVDFNEPDNTSSQMGEWCSGCHTNFHGTPGVDANIGGAVLGSSYQQLLRHPDGGVDIGGTGDPEHSDLALYNSYANKVKVMSEVGTWSPAGTDVTPSCFSCHKAHGNGNAFGLIYRSGTGTLTENGDTSGSQYENLCGQCHTQAAIFNP